MNQFKDSENNTNERGLLIIRHLRDINDLANGRDSSIEADQEVIALEIAQEIYADFEQSGASAIFLSVSSKKRALETAELIRKQMKSSIDDVHFFISPDENLVDLDHGEFILPENYMVDDFYAPIAKAWQVFSNETFNKNNYGYRFGDSMPNSDGTSQYPELAEVFTKPGDSHQDISRRLYKYILDVHSLKPRFEAGKIRPYILTHSLPFSELRSMADISNKVRDEEFTFETGELMALCWDYYNSGKIGSSDYGQIATGLTEIINNDVFIQMIRDEIDFIEAQEHHLARNSSIRDTEYDAIILASKEGKVHEWVISFLESSGNNLRLAEKLSDNSQFCYGPIDYPITDLVNLVEEDPHYYEDPSITESKLGAMIESMDKGWNPVPIIATNLWIDVLEIADGCHRQMMLKRKGVTTFPVIFYFRDQASLDNFVESIN
jgi:broad specificity phosphatase PhoE